MPSEVACRMSRIDHHYEVEPLNDTQPRGHSINLSPVSLLELFLLLHLVHL